MALIARSKNSYFVPPEKFNLVGMFSSPMMLIMLAMGAMMFAMPWIMDNMDPEAVEDARKMQAKVFGAQQAIQRGDLSGAFKKVTEEQVEPAGASAAAAASPSSQLKQRAQKKKR